MFISHRIMFCRFENRNFCSFARKHKGINAHTHTNTSKYSLTHARTQIIQPASIHHQPKPNPNPNQHSRRKEEDEKKEKKARVHVPKNSSAPNKDVVYNFTTFSLYFRLCLVRLECYLDCVEGERKMRCCVQAPSFFFVRSFSFAFFPLCTMD